MFDRTNLPAPAFGPTGETVFQRTYSRALPDGTPETWADTVERVVTGNLGLVYGPPEDWTADVQEEAQALFETIYHFRAIPAGRHLWASGVPGRQYLFNCHVSGWGERFADHFEFTFLRLMEGGGVGANYSTPYLEPYGAPRRSLRVNIVCDDDHPDFRTLEDKEVLSARYAASWPGAFRIEDSREGWAEALVDLIETFFSDDEVRHEDRVYDVSNVRPEGAPLRTFGGTASGPLPLAVMLRTVADVLNRAFERGAVTPLDAMEIDHAIGMCVVAGGVRRSARMSIVRWDDPYVFEFIDSKKTDGAHWTTNISVEVDDAFFEALAGEVESIVDFNGDVVRTLQVNPLHDHAQRVMAAVAEGMLANGEPGLWNSSLSNVGEVAPVEATNPCGEIALQPWENCNLGHVNLEAFVRDDGTVDIEGLHEAHSLMARFLIRATFGDVNDERQADTLAANRRIGVGHLGVQGFLVRLGVTYSDAVAAPVGQALGAFLEDLRETVRGASRDYAFELRIPEPVKVTTVAPTGTIAKMPGATEGIHPVYARYFLRRVRFSTLRAEERAQIEKFRAEGYKVEPDLYAANTMVVEIPTKERLVDVAERLGFAPEIVQDASEISLEAMLAFQRLYQTCYADNAVSFTVNVPEGRYTTQEVIEMVTKYLPELKGTTLMPDGTRAQAPYERLTREEFEAITSESTAVVDDSYDEACASGACPIR